MIDLELQNLILEQIKNKSQIKDLEEEFILSRLNQFFLTNGDKRKKLETEFKKNQEKIIKNKHFKETIKIIRQEIGILYGSYQTSKFNKKEKFLENKKYDELLECHKSTKERIDFYEQVYNKIFSWYKPKIGISDLACGLNPLSYTKIPYYKKLEFFSSDLNPSDMKFVQEFFNLNLIKGTAIAHDITNLKFLKDKTFQKTDLLILFKALDSFETIKKNISKEILEKVPQSHIVISFPTKSLVSKKEFKSEKRNWLRNFFKLKEWNYEEFEIENEMFFLVKKNVQ